MTKTMKLFVVLVSLVICYATYDLGIYWLSLITAFGAGFIFCDYLFEEDKPKPRRKK